MPGAARLNDSIQGTTGGEHTGHVPPHGPLPISGQISGGCSGDVNINGQPAATVGSTTSWTLAVGLILEPLPLAAAPFLSMGNRRPAWGTLWPPIVGPGPSPPAAPMS